MYCVSRLHLNLNGYVRCRVYPSVPIALQQALTHGRRDTTQALRRIVSLALRGSLLTESTWYINVVKGSGV